MNHYKTITISAVTSIIVVAALFLIIYGAALSNRTAVINFLLQSEKTGRAPNSDLRGEEALVVNAVRKATPAVVSIVIEKDVGVLERNYHDLFEELFPGLDLRIPDLNGGTEKRKVGGGSGFLASEDGYIVTNRHVVDDDKASYTVFTNDGKKYEARIVARDPSIDIAILKIEGRNFPYLSFGDSNSIEVGQTVIAIGNALGEFRNTVSVGVISGLSRSVVASSLYGISEQLDEVIQTDAAINLGNSGGPLVSLGGQIVGVNVAVAQGSENIGFALPANSVKGAVESVRRMGKIVRPYLGVRYVSVTEDLKEEKGLSVDYGKLVIRGTGRGEAAVVSGSPAAKAGIEESDIILEIDGVKLTAEKSLASIIRNKAIGDKVRLLVLRDGKKREVEVMLEATR